MKYLLKCILFERVKGISSLIIRFKEADDLRKMASDLDKLGNVRYFILLKVEDTKKYLKNPLGLFV